MISVLLLSCSSAKNSSEIQLYRGEYRSGFELSAFVPENGKERWWLSFAGDVDRSKLNTTVATERRFDSNNYKLLIKGKLSEKGHYGHMGAYTREITVTEIIEAVKL